MLANGVGVGDMGRRAALLVLPMVAASCGSIRVPIGTLATREARIVFEAGAGVAAGTEIRGGARFATPEVRESSCAVGQLEDWRSAVDTSYRVRVFYEGLTEPLYGLIQFCNVASDFAGPASRSYEVIVPPGRVAETTDGRMSYVYETAGSDRAAWRLWISRIPFAGP